MTWLSVLCRPFRLSGRTVNKDIYLVGVDALDAALNEVANGNMTGTF